MFSLTSSYSYFLYANPTDMRKSFDGLCGLVSSCLDRNPQSGAVFIFINRLKDKVKLLHWEAGGFALYYKRLESGTFQLPSMDGPCYAMSWWELTLMIEGISAVHIRKRKRHLST